MDEQNLLTGKSVKNWPAPSEAQVQAYKKSLPQMHPHAFTPTSSTAGAAAQPASRSTKGRVNKPRFPLWVKLAATLAGVAALGVVIGFSTGFAGLKIQMTSKKEDSQALSSPAQKKSKKASKKKKTRDSFLEISS